jgi:hypothetical protein
MNLPSSRKGTFLFSGDNTQNTYRLFFWKIYGIMAKIFNFLQFNQNFRGCDMNLPKMILFEEAVSC